MAVYGVGDTGTVCLAGRFGLQQEHFTGFFCLFTVVGISSCDGITGLPALCVQVLISAQFTVFRLQEIGTGIEIETGCYEVFTDLMIHVPVFYVGIERCGSGMIHGYACSDAYGLSF